MNKYKIRQIIFAVANVLFVFGGLFLIIGSEYSEKASTGFTLNGVGVALLIIFGLFWAVAFAAGFPSFLRKWLNGQ
jgi:hypothetical protein